MNKPVGMDLEEIMQELHMLCVARGVKTPNVTLLVPLDALMAIQKDEQIKASKMDVVGHCGDTVASATTKIDYGPLGSCDVKAADHYLLLKRWAGQDLLTRAVKYVMELDYELKRVRRREVALMTEEHRASVVEQLVKDFKEVVKEEENIDEEVRLHRGVLAAALGHGLIGGGG